MAVIRYGYLRQVQPPAPFVNLVLRHPRNGNEMHDVPAQLDTGADRTVMPEKLVQALGLPRIGRFEMEGLGGAIHVLFSFAVLLRVHDLSFQRLEAIACSDEEWILLGRDVLNNHRIVLDGPQLALEIS
jgi:hypothetical protein